MLLIHGRYFWGRTLLAFRNDYCLTCKAPRLAYLHRTFDVFHIFWIPVLPLGFWKRWHCGTCGNNPHARVTTSVALKWVGVVLLALFAAVTWVPDVQRDIPDPILRLALRLGMIAAVLIAAWLAARSRPPENLREKLRGIQANRDGTCPRCGTALTVGSPWYRCGKCGLERQALPAP
jgi:ribosomal protein S27AE